MNIAERASNFLCITNDDPESRQDFPALFKPNTREFGDFVGMGKYFLFADESVLFALEEEGCTALIITTKDEAPLELLFWAIKEGRLKEMLEKLQNWLNEQEHSSQDNTTTH